MVVSTEGGLTLSRRLARGAATDQQLEDAFRAGLPVEGKVERDVKGGYEVRIGRPARLLPVLADRHRPGHRPGGARRARLRVPDPRYKEGGKNLIVSRRALLEEEQRARAASPADDRAPARC